MKLSELDPQTLAAIRSYRWDRIIEKHEGPENWDSEFKWGEPEILQAGPYNVLLPVERERHKNITFLRVIPSADGACLTLFLKDTTFADDPKWEFFSAGFLAVCERVLNQDLYIAVVYHEWFMLPTPQQPGDLPIPLG